MLNDRISLFGLPVVAGHQTEVVREILERVTARQRVLILSLNVDICVKLLRQPEDEQLRDAFRTGDVIVPDGMPIVWASRLLGTPLPMRIPGVDLMVDLCRAAAERDLSVFFLGAARGVGDQSAAVLQRRFPGLRVAGVYAPPMGFEKAATEVSKATAAVNMAKPDFLFVAFGSPKTEKWLHEVRAQLKAYAVMVVGASLDMVAGSVPRAPPWMRKAGLEWSWRLLREPKRLWRRYLVDDVLFPFYVWREWRRKRWMSKGGSHEP